MSIFEKLDDEAGIVPDPARKHRVKSRARAMRTRRRILAGAVILAAPLSALALLVADDREPVRVATDATLPTVPPVVTLLPPLPEGTVTTPAPTPRPDDPPSSSPPPTATPTTATTHPDPGYELTTQLDEDFDSGVSGHAGAGRRGSTTWDVFVKVQRLVPGRRYSVLVHRPEPDHGTPFPTVCSLVATSDGFGACSGPVESEGGPPTNVSLTDGETGRAVAQGYFR